MLVNSKGETEEIEVINSVLEDADREIDWAGTRLVEALKRRESVGTWERMKAAIMEGSDLVDLDMSCFDGRYVTGTVSEEYLAWVEGSQES